MYDFTLAISCCVKNQTSQASIFVKYIDVPLFKAVTIRPTLNNVFKCEKYRGIKLISRLCDSLSHMHEQKFKHNFQAVVVLMLSQLLIKFCTAPYTMMKDIPS